MALVGVELKTLVSESDALTTRPPPCANSMLFCYAKQFVSAKCTSSGICLVL